jgi:hypothetical protein
VLFAVTTDKKIITINPQTGAGTMLSTELQTSLLFAIAPTVRPAADAGVFDAANEDGKGLDATSDGAPDAGVPDGGGRAGGALVVLLVGVVAMARRRRRG